MEKKNMQEFSYLVDKEVKAVKKLALILMGVIAIFFFSFGVYFSHDYFNKKSLEHTPLNSFNRAYDMLINEWYYADEFLDLDEELIARAIGGMVSGEEDKYARYLPKMEVIQSSAVGIGISLIEYEDYFKITSINSLHAFDAGLRVGDVIIKIDGEDLNLVNIDDISSYIIGKSEAEIEIKRPGYMSHKTFVVPIKQYSVETVFDNDTFASDIYYVRIEEFGLETDKNLRKLLLANTKNKLVLDLRDNPGGYIDSVVKVADLFLDKDKVVLETRDKNNKSHKYKTRTDEKFEFEKIVILMNRNSASGAEALAAALNENMDEKVILFGETTYGKGSAQMNQKLSDNTILIYTYALWYTPDGNEINEIGVAPEIQFQPNDINDVAILNVELEKNDYGLAVKHLQAVLKLLNYHTNDWETPGYYNHEVEQAVKDFQQDIGLEVTGILNKRTIRHLSARIYDRVLVNKNDQRNDAKNLF